MFVFMSFTYKDKGVRKYGWGIHKVRETFFDPFLVETQIEEEQWVDEPKVLNYKEITFENYQFLLEKGAWDL